MSEKAGFPKKAIFGVIGMLTFGTGTMISAKLMLDMSAKGLNGSPAHKFEKPVFQSLIMFIGMSMCIFIHLGNVGVQSIIKLVKSKKEGAAVDGDALLPDIDEPLTDEGSASEVEAEVEAAPSRSAGEWAKLIWVKSQGYWLIAIPASFDLLATTLMTFGLIFIDVSVMQMLRGSMVVFSALLSVFLLKRHITMYQWTGVAIVATACGMVGISCIMSASGNANARPAAQQALGCIAVVASQFIQASQIVAEDLLLHNIDAAPLQIVGMEGVWGGLISAFIIYPIAMLVPGKDPAFPLPYPCAENVFDDFMMMFNNKLILLFTVIYVVCILVLNYSGMVVTSALTAVHRTIFEAVRTLAIWLVDLIIYYVVLQHTVYGERWDLTWSWLQGAGFATLLFGMSVHNDLIRFPLFNYDGPKSKEVSPSSSDAGSDIEAQSVDQELI